MTRTLKTKAANRERRKKKEFKSLLYAISAVAAVTFVLSLVIVKLLISVGSYAVKPFFSFLLSERKDVSPYLKTDLDSGMFNNFYRQHSPVMFPYDGYDLLIQGVPNETEYCWNSSINTLSLSDDISNLEFVAVDNATISLSRAVGNFLLLSRDISIGPPILYNSNKTVASEVAIDSTHVYFALSKTRLGISHTPTFSRRPQGWEHLLYGRRKWFLYRPGTVPPFDPDLPLQNWLDTVYPDLSLSERPIEIIQEEGFVIYIPEGWYRAYIPLPPSHSSPSSIQILLNNFDCLTQPTQQCDNSSIHHDTVYSLSLQQYADSPELSALSYFHMHFGQRSIENGDIPDALEHLNNAVRRENDFASFYLLGKLLVENGDHALGEKYLRRATILNRLHLRAHISLINKYVNERNYEEAKKVLVAAGRQGLEQRDELSVYKYILNMHM
mmetsp:Transcript_2674/g.4005  ORF Transcript_2674/g.4005 Transcript_2674/m.4005 type:complete len:442 (-) Transcript_2674:119-1444(-)|eukprot:CAMPEP_0185041166 /NCGR_PEP_ID=MMETSP1103-20130426/40079_1 /TAXON_ID=36769 /ORGANISM="Paraphysomonas bandaiensis, Strain Caron Lab Isolate" /LENGTH=441 /DNA_ID=CAMNT_0027580775 /DNA_START=18 /DNA_END=1343 /DNA_ORIENTATION=-